MGYYSYDKQIGIKIPYILYFASYVLAIVICLFSSETPSDWGVLEYHIAGCWLGFITAVSFLGVWPEEGIKGCIFFFLAFFIPTFISVYDTSEFKGIGS